MSRSKRGLWRIVCGAVLGAVYLGLVASAAAWTEPLWVRQPGTANSDEAAGVAPDAAGNVYLTGTSSYFIGYDGYADAWSAKYSATGRLQWKRLFETEEDWATAAGVATDASSNVYVTGTIGGAGSGPNSGPGNVWVAKYNAAGRLLWKRQLATETNDSASGVATDAAGNVYLSGPGSDGYSQHYWIVKYNAGGRVLWKRKQEASDVVTDAAGNVYLTGSTGGSLGGPQRGEGDAWVAEYDAAGRLVWKRQLGSVGGDSGRGVATHGACDVYLTGSTWGSLGGPNHGVVDAWLAKYSTRR